MVKKLKKAAAAQAPKVSKQVVSKDAKKGTEQGQATEEKTVMDGVTPVKILELRTGKIEGSKRPEDYEWSTDIN